MSINFTGVVPSTDPSKYFMTNPPECEYEKVNEEELKTMFRNFVEKKWLWKKKKALDIKTSKFENVCCYHIKVKSFYETREVQTRERPYSGQMIDGKVVGGEEFKLFDFEVEYPDMFNEDIKWYNIPHTESLIICQDCEGNGRRICYRCRNGYIQCEFCQPVDSVNHENPKQCKECLGEGRKICKNCSGTGTKICEGCVGSGKMIQYSVLCVEFCNDESDRVINPTKLEDKKIIEADGITMIDIREKKLKRFEWSEYPMINDKMNMLLGTIDTNIRNKKGKLIFQRGIIRMVPLSHILTDINYDIYCIGTNKKIDSPNYPSKCVIM